jgi:hypothetical protein
MIKYNNSIYKEQNQAIPPAQVVCRRLGQKTKRFLKDRFTDLNL